MSRWYRVLTLGLLVWVSLASGCGQSEPVKLVGPVARKKKPAAEAKKSPPQGESSPAADPAEKGAEGSQRVVIKTSLGPITVELDRRRAPQTVAQFLRFVDQGRYDGTIFHQVVGGCLVLGGGFTPDLHEKTSPRAIPSEANNGLANRRGTIAMARRLEEVDSATGQFFINLADNPMFDHRDDAPEGFGYCVFGHVVDGWDVLERMEHVPVADTPRFDRLPVETVLIESATRLR